MRSALKAIAWLGLGGLGVVGCAERAKRPVIVPPKEEFHIPPADSPVFSGPVQYPKEMLNNVPPPRPKTDEEKFGSGPGMGGQGMPSLGRAGP